MIQQALVFNSRAGFAIAQQVMTRKISNQHHFLVHASERAANKHEVRMNDLRLLAKQVQSSATKQELLLIEARAAKIYWKQFANLVVTRAEWRGRRDNSQPIVALLNIGYHHVSKVIEKTLVASGLDPGIGFLHQYRRGRDPLVYDMMELFRPAVDITLLGFVRRRKTPLVEIDDATIAKFVLRIKRNLHRASIVDECTKLRNFVLGKRKFYIPYRWKWGHK